MVVHVAAGHLPGIVAELEGLLADGAVALRAHVGGGDGEQGVDVVGEGLADPDEDPGRERDARFAGGFQGGQPPGRGLVR